MLSTSMVQGKPMSTAQQALSKSVHFTLGSSHVQDQHQSPPTQSQLQFPASNETQVQHVTSIDCVEHRKPLKGFCIEPECQFRNRKLCVGCLWDHNCSHKMQQPDFVKTLQDKVHIAGPNFFEHLQKILRKDHLQEEIDAIFLKIRQEFDSYLAEMYSQFMWWSKHGMGNQLQGNEIVSALLFDEKIVEEMQEMVLKGKGMEASDDTIDVCVKILNSDAAEITTLPDHLKIALDQSEVVIRQTLKDLEGMMEKIRSSQFEFQDIPPDVQIPQLRIPGLSGGIQSFGNSGVQKGPGLSFINSASQLPGQQSAMSTNYHQRYGSPLAQQLSPKLFADIRDLHQSQVWAICKVNSQVVATGDWQGNIKIIGISADGQYQFMQALNHGKNVYALSNVIGRESYLISAGQNIKDEWTIKIWDLERAILIKELKGHMNYIFSLVMPNPNQIVSSSYDETIRIWDFDSGNNIRTIKEFKTSFNDLCVWSQDEVISCSDDKAIRMFNINSGLMKLQIFDQCFVNGVARVSDKEIAVGNFKEEQKIVRRMGSHKNFVWRVKVKCCQVIDNDLIASASFDKTVKIWEWRSGSLVSSLEGHTEIVRALELLEDNYFLVSGSDDKSIKLWRLI